jgi:maltooligosyltrehalose trehalohydrolase
MEATTQSTSHELRRDRRLPVGAEVVPGGGHFRVWAPRRERVDVVLEGAGDPVPLAREETGYFSGLVPRAAAGSRYRYRLDGGGAFPDPASRCQPEGPHGPSQVIDPGTFRWSDGRWPGVSLEGQVIYELHVGTFTPEGTWQAAARELPALAALGITLVEVMPVADFPGRFGWGYDGVALFAPTRLYGSPDDVRHFVDRAHALGVGVLLDVVYNHLGPDGNYLRQFSDAYFSDRHTTDWGDALNFDGPGSEPVREFYLANAGYWIEEFHLDGLRLDATHAIHDTSDDHILTAIGRRVRERARGRGTLVIAEDEPARAGLVRRPGEGGQGLDAVWSDDFHHSARVAATGRREGYYRAYRGTPQELISAIKWGPLFQGTRRTPREAPRGLPAFGVPPARFVHFLQNHDQIAHSGHGLRLHALTSAGRWRALTALLLLGPETPLLFMGQEFAASSPFLFFADHEPGLARLVREGRARLLSQFASLADPAAQAGLADPGAPATFVRCKLDPSERERHAAAASLHRDLLALRRSDPVFRAQRERGMDGAVLAEAALALRFFGEGGRDRLLLLNLGRDLPLAGWAEPLLAASGGSRWALLWSSEDPRYGGGGTPEPARDGGLVPGESAIVLAAEESP